MFNRDFKQGSEDDCFFCGSKHPNQICSKVKAVEFFENGKMKRVEFHDLPPVNLPFVATSPTAGKA